jgi:hypothetical protein
LGEDGQGFGAPSLEVIALGGRMHLLFLLARIYPFVAFSLAFVMWHLALFFFRRRNRLHMIFSSSVVGLVISGGVWIYFRGDLHSDEWVRFLLER